MLTKHTNTNAPGGRGEGKRPHSGRPQAGRKHTYKKAVSGSRGVAKRSVSDGGGHRDDPSVKTTHGVNHSTNDDENFVLVRCKNKSKMVDGSAVKHMDDVNRPKTLKVDASFDIPTANYFDPLSSEELHDEVMEMPFALEDVSEEDAVEVLGGDITGTVKMERGDTNNDSFVQNDEGVILGDVPAEHNGDVVVFAADTEEAEALTKGDGHEDVSDEDKSSTKNTDNEGGVTVGVGSARSSPGKRRSSSNGGRRKNHFSASRPNGPHLRIRGGGPDTIETKTPAGKGSVKKITPEKGDEKNGNGKDVNKEDVIDLCSDSDGDSVDKSKSNDSDIEDDNDDTEIIGDGNRPTRNRQPPKMYVPAADADVTDRDFNWEKEDKFLNPEKYKDDDDDDDEEDISDQGQANLDSDDDEDDDLVHDDSSSTSSSSVGPNEAQAVTSKREKKPSSSSTVKKNTPEKDEQSVDSYGGGASDLSDASKKPNDASMTLVNREQSDNEVARMHTSGALSHCNGLPSPKRLAAGILASNDDGDDDDGVDDVDDDGDDDTSPAAAGFNDEEDEETQRLLDELAEQNHNDREGQKKPNTTEAGAKIFTYYKKNVSPNFFNERPDTILAKFAKHMRDREKANETLPETERITYNTLKTQMNNLLQLMDQYGKSNYSERAKKVFFDQKRTYEAKANKQREEGQDAYQPLGEEDTIHIFNGVFSRLAAERERLDVKKTKTLREKKIKNTKMKLERVASKCRYFTYKDIDTLAALLLAQQTGRRSFELQMTTIADLRLTKTEGSGGKIYPELHMVSCWRKDKRIGIGIGRYPQKILAYDKLQKNAVVLLLLKLQYMGVINNALDVYEFKEPLKPDPKKYESADVLIEKLKRACATFNAETMIKIENGCQESVGRLLDTLMKDEDPLSDDYPLPLWVGIDGKLGTPFSERMKVKFFYERLSNYLCKTDRNPVHHHGYKRSEKHFIGFTSTRKAWRDKRDTPAHGIVNVDDLKNAHAGHSTAVANKYYKNRKHLAENTHGNFDGLENREDAMKIASEYKLPPLYSQENYFHQDHKVLTDALPLPRAFLEDQSKVKLNFHIQCPAIGCTQSYRFFADLYRYHIKPNAYDRTKSNAHDTKTTNAKCICGSELKLDSFFTNHCTNGDIDKRGVCTEFKRNVYFRDPSPFKSAGQRNRYTSKAEGEKAKTHKTVTEFYSSASTGEATKQRKPAPTDDTSSKPAAKPSVDSVSNIGLDNRKTAPIEDTVVADTANRKQPPEEASQSKRGRKRPNEETRKPATKKRKPSTKKKPDWKCAFCKYQNEGSTLVCMRMSCRKSKSSSLFP